jgi:hypothetical protein
MGDVLTFPAIWDRLAPLYPKSWEINCIVVVNWLETDVPRTSNLSIFEHKWLDRISGYRNREVYNYLNDTRNFYDATVALKIYGQAGLPENIRWP